MFREDLSVTCGYSSSSVVTESSESACWTETEGVLTVALHIIVPTHFEETLILSQTFAFPLNDVIFAHIDDSCQFLL